MLLNEGCYPENIRGRWLCRREGEKGERMGYLSPRMTTGSEDGVIPDSGEFTENGINGRGIKGNEERVQCEA